MALALNIALLVLETRGLYLSISDRKWKILLYYTQISNLLTVLASLLLVVFGQTELVAVFRYTSVCMMVHVC